MILINANQKCGRQLPAHCRLNLATANLEEVLSASKYQEKKHRGFAKDFNENWKITIELCMTAVRKTWQSKHRGSISFHSCFIPVKFFLQCSITANWRCLPPNEMDRCWKWIVCCFFCLFVFLTLIYETLSFFFHLWIYFQMTDNSGKHMF